MSQNSCFVCRDNVTCKRDERATDTGCEFYEIQQNAFLTKEEEAPLNHCVECKNMVCVKTGIICRAVEKLLPKPRSGGHPKEFSSDKVEILHQLHKERESGRRKKPHIQPDGWDES